MSDIGYRLTDSAHLLPKSLPFIGMSLFQIAYQKIESSYRDHGPSLFCT